MRILFGIQGTGNGHLSRCHQLATALRHQPISVDYLISGRQPTSLFDCEVFGDFKLRRGLTFVTESGRIKPLKSALKNSLPNLMSEARALDLTDYDLVISDFEPVTAWAAKINHKRCIGIGRQYAFKERDLYRQLTVWQRLLINYFAPANEWLGMHWQPLGNCLPPVIRPHKATEPSGKHVLVYLPFENLYEVVDSLLPFNDYTFSVFHPHIGTAKYFGCDHIMGLPPSRQAFAEQLSIATGVIANAGFETTCEALNQAKFLAVKPLSGQFEQAWNAKLLLNDSRARVLKNISEASIGSWLQSIEQQPMPSAMRWSHVALHITDWLAKGAKGDKRDLLTTLWDGSPGWIRTNDTWINSPPL